MKKEEGIYRLASELGYIRVVREGRRYLGHGCNYDEVTQTASSVTSSGRYLKPEDWIWLQGNKVECVRDLYKEDWSVG